MRNFQILSTTPAFGGATPRGASGPYEIIAAVAHGALDPHARSNAGIVDLVNAPAAADGLVDYSTDVVILRPVHANDARRLLVYEVVNRGRKLAVGSFIGASPDGKALPKQDFPSLLANGATIVWSGWQGDLALNGTSAIAGKALIGTRFPNARRVNGSPITGMSREEFIPDYAGGPPDRIPLSYPPADAADRQSVTFTARQSWLTGYGRSSSGHPSYDAPSVPVSTWHYAVGKDGATEIVFTPPADVPGPAGAPVPGNAGTIYSFVYRAKDPMVDGIGFAAVRDLIAFLRAGKPDVAGHADPLADLTAAHCALASCQNEPAEPVDVAVGVGISQSGRFLRDFLYQGFNDDDGHRVFDGLMPIIAGARRTWVNERFAQPGRWSKEHEDHWQVGDQFPFTYDVRSDRFSHHVDGLLRACRVSQTCPKIMQVDGAFEWWGARASLVVTDGNGHDVKLPASVRYYLIAGTKHGGGKGIGDGVVSLPGAGSACQLPDSPVSEGPAERALLQALIAWTGKGILPPASAYPTAANGTAVLPAHAFPALHDLVVPIGSAATPTKLPLASSAQINQIAETRYLAALPKVRPGTGYVLLVPKTDASGNAVAGIRMPDISVPLATYTGWNLRATGHAVGEACLLSGAAIPLAVDKAQRAAGDSRPALDELYAGRADYAGKVKAAASDLVTRRYLLPRDATASYIEPAARVSKGLISKP